MGCLISKFVTQQLYGNLDIDLNWFLMTVRGEGGTEKLPVTSRGRILKWDQTQKRTLLIQGDTR